ncbi:MAG: Ig-like domain-containing protein [Nitrospirae bacterium]|nr:Ig-like domain-containing protein [Nitrospirota bacterium]
MKGTAVSTRNLIDSFLPIFLGCLVLLLTFGCTKPEQPTAPEAPPPTLPPALSKLEIKPLGSSLEVGDSQPLAISAMDANNQERTDITVTWASENPSVVTVNPQGTVTAISPGTSTITAFSEGISASVQMEVRSPAAAQVEIQPSVVSLTTGDTQQLQAIATDSKKREIKGLPVTWKSKNPSKATVDKDGLVTAQAAGTAAIIATVQDKTVSVQVTVSKPGLAKLAIQPETASGMVGDDLRLKAVVVDAKGKEQSNLSMNWKSDNPAIATVNPSGAVSLKSAGTVTIIASAEGKTASAVVTVTTPPIAKIEIRPGATTLRVGETKQFEAIILDVKNRERKDPNVVWQTNTPSIANVSAGGVVTATSAGSALITASLGGVTSNSASVTIRAKEAPSGRLSKEELKAKFKGADPSELIYLSGITGEIAGTGDPTKFAGEAEQAGLSQHPLALELADLPKDRYGLIDWATAIKTGKVKPRYSLDPRAGPDEVPLELDVVIFTKSQFQPDVIFPHFVHTLWLTCTNCHPSIFPMNAKEANKMMTMPKIASGEFCGRCHNRIAFPLSDCLRCHVKPKDTPPIDPDYQAQKGKTP